MDRTMISPALGTITSEFGTIKDVGWYTSANLMTTAATQCLYGAVYKIFDTKWTFIFSICLFEVGSLIAALSPTSSVLILGRAVSGLGGAGLSSGSYVIIAKVVPLQKRASFLGLFGGIWGIASICGPLLGGFFAGSVTWRWCFYINLPIGGVTLAAMLFFPSPNTHNDGNRSRVSVLSKLIQLDLLGAAVLLPTVVMLLLALQWGGGEFAWSSGTIIGLFLGAGLLGVIFAVTQVIRQDGGLLPPSLFQERDVACGMLYNLFFGGFYYVMLPYLSIYHQVVQGVHANQVGLRLLPLSLSAVLSSSLSGIVISRLKTYNFVLLAETGLATVAAGLTTRFSLGTAALVLQNTVPYHMIPLASAGVQFFGILGGAVSVASAQAAFQKGLVDAMRNDVPQVAPSIVINTGATQLRHTLEGLGQPEAVIQAVLNSYATGLRNTFYICTAAATASFFVALGFRWKSPASTALGCSG
ncbi:major facilitator superfamily transporter [Colletotrichum nymphaeae SA-01]|uniref:Major facilitator superfamily transporter n=1 Tax=Colletotrichum nymphaeae SA-01 TaxID=1460502 RepID=A0A135U0N6_9PEZI|nr:major facilitator superfamily transporter [Colletotrichum nymphaeae SA-01]